VTDAAGNFQFSGIYVGIYQFYVVGPWQEADGKPIMVMLRSNHGSAVPDFTLRPGPNQPDLDPAGWASTPSLPPSSTSSAARPSGTAPRMSTSTGAAAVATTTSTGPAAAPQRLANTGVSVLGPVAGALALLAAGIGAVVVTRRRRAAN
jgi:hypothetical protein